MEIVPEGFISRRDAIIAAVIASMFGAGMALFAVGWFQLVFDAQGNPAEWTAAIGTWVIGYGAWRIARDSHDHRIKESDQQAIKDSDARNAALWQMLVKASSTKVWRPRAASFAERPPGDQTVGALLSLIHVAIKVFEGKRWSDAERAMLSQEGINALAALEFELMAHLDTLGSLHARLSKDASTYPGEREAIILLLMKMSEALAADADAFIEQIRALMTPWNRDGAKH